MILSPQALLGLSLVLLVVSVAVFVFLVVRRTKAQRLGASVAPAQPRIAPSPPESTLADPPAAEPPVSEVDPASLLVPLGTLPWSPPDTPADPNELAGVALAGRISEFTTTSTPDVPEVDFHEPWVVEPRGLAGLEAGERPRGFVESWSTALETPEIANGDDERLGSGSEAVPRTDDRTRAPEVVLAAPVELWFEGSRVGVRAGSATYDRFRQIADALLIDLNDARKLRR